MKPIPTFCLAAGLASLAVPALAQTELRPRDEETVIVTATRTPQAPRSVGASVAVLDQDRLTSAGHVPVVDVLRDVPGVSFSRNGGVGGVTGVRIRGAESDQTVVLIDGVQLNDPSQPGGGFNFANLLVGDLERIELLRGPQSTLYGSQAIGGVVQLITREAVRPFEANVSLEAGELETTSVRAAVRGIVGALRYGISAGQFESGSISAAAAGRERDSYENSAVQARASYEINPALSVEGRAWWSSGDVGIDGFPAPTFTLADTPERSVTEELIVVGAARLALLDGRWRTRLGASRTTTDRESLNPALSIPLTFEARGTNERIDLTSVLDIGARTQLVAGAEREEASFRTRSPSSFNPNPVPATAQASISAVYAQLQATPVDGLTATLGIRHSDHDRFGSALNGRVTLAWSFNGGDTILRAALADAFKAPTLFQLFSDFGNRTLQPEEATSAEIGIEQAWLGRKIVAGLTRFERDATNQIDFVSCFGSNRSICVNRPFGTYDNVARARADGFEATLEVRPLPQLALLAGYATLDARNAVAGSANFGRRLPRRPENTLSLGASWQFGPGQEIAASWTSVGDGFDNASNSVRLPGYELLTLRASWAIGESWSLYGRIENATDEAYQTTAGYGSPPRQATVGLRAQF